MQQFQSNPFAVTKAVDFTDLEIFDLWVDYARAKNLKQFARPASPMPTLILGGKGSGKTHWMRYYSLPLQKIRHERDSVNFLEGLKRDGYVGIYLLMGGLNAERFKGKGIHDDLWKELFAYYFELWLAQESLTSIEKIISSDVALSANEAEFVARCILLFDVKPDIQLHTVRELADYISSLQKSLDYAVNNAAFTRKIDAVIRVTRGRMIFGIPDAFVATFKPLSELIFVYQLDELENFDVPQQRLVNSLVREHRPPVTFRVGARLYGIKTLETYSAGEENREGSEFEQLHLDERLREDSGRYEEFARELIGLRLSIDDRDKKALATRLDGMFRTVDLGWNSSWLRDHLSLPDSARRPWFTKLKGKLLVACEKGVARGVKSEKDVDNIVAVLSAPDCPILEKVNILAFHKAWHAKKDLPDSAIKIAAECRDFIESGGGAGGHYGNLLQHFRSDLVAQIARETEKNIPLYAGLDNFISMSDGLPRTLVVLLKNVWDWAIYRREKASPNSPISLEAQELGVRQTADWFLENMRKTGKDGVAIRTAIERLATLFRLSRFSDKPVECSLIGFSVNESQMDDEAARILRLAERYSFLIRVPGGQKERASAGLVTMKFQLNRMLAPRWDLPLARRGIASFKAEDANCIFDPALQSRFEALAREWEANTSAPYYGKKKASKDQQELF